MIGGGFRGVFLAWHSRIGVTRDFQFLKPPRRSLGGSGPPCDGEVQTAPARDGSPVPSSTLREGVLVGRPAKVALLVARSRNRPRKGTKKGDSHGGAKPGPFGLNLASKPGKVSKNLFNLHSGKAHSGAKVLSGGLVYANEPALRTMVKGTGNLNPQASKSCNLFKDGFGSAKNESELGLLSRAPASSHGFSPGTNGTNPKFCMVMTWIRILICKMVMQNKDYGLY
nr:hypothetical protein Iba_chr06cCG11710 [Ipomoea batatas]GMD09486.1 hypothetical protein Iba_chr06dCG8620 [Ipomoea batatas]